MDQHLGHSRQTVRGPTTITVIFLGSCCLGRWLPFAQTKFWDIIEESPESVSGATMHHMFSLMSRAFS